MKNILMKKISPSIILLCIGLFLYLPLWMKTVEIASVQAGQHIAPTLPVLGGDSMEYKTLADTILSKHCFSLSKDCSISETFRVPGYPFFIDFFSVLFHSVFAVTFVQWLLALLTGYLLYKISCLFLPQEVSIYLMIIFLIEPSVVLYSLILLSEIPFLCIIIASVYLLLKRVPNYRTLFLIGCLLGLSVLFRPISLFLLFIYGFFYVWLYKANIKIYCFGLCFLCLGVGLCVVPWVVRNYEVSGVATVSSITPYNLFHYNLPLFLSSKTGESVSSVEHEMLRQSGLTESERIQEAEYSSTLWTADKKILLDYPFSYTVFHIVKTIPFFLSSSLENAKSSIQNIFNLPLIPTSSLSNYIVHLDVHGFLSHLSSDNVIILENIVWLLISVCALASYFCTDKKKETLFLLIIIFYFALLTGPVSSPRYRLPAEPLMFVTCAITVWYILQRYLYT